MIYFVSRHPGALQWMQDRFIGQPARVLTHLPGDFSPGPGDRIFGVLPLQWVQRITAAGAQAWVLEVELPPELRGRELTAEQLSQRGAALVLYEARALEHLP